MKATFDKFKKNIENWKNISDNRSIFIAAVIIGFISIFVKMMTVGKDLFTVYIFGLSDTLDAFFISLLLPMFFINILAGSVNSAFIPTFIKVREQEGKENSGRLYSTVFLICLSLFIAVTAILFIFAPTLLDVICGDASFEKRELALKLFHFTIFLIPVMGSSILISSVINTGGRFAFAAGIPALTPIIIVISLIFFKKYEIHTLVLAQLAGALAEFFILLLYGKKKCSIPLLPSWGGITPDLKKVAGQYLPMVAGAFLMSSTILVDNTMAARFNSGSISALKYGSKLISFFLEIIALALGTAVLPYFAKMIARADYTGAKHTLRTYSRLILIVLIPLTVIMFLFSTPMVKLIFERGNFTSANTLIVAKIQAMYILQLPFYILGILGVRLMSSLLMNSHIFMIAGINLTINIILNIVLMKIMGIAGIALSTSIVYLISCTLIFISVNSKLKTLITTVSHRTSEKN